MSSKKSKKKESDNLYEPVNPPPLYGNASYLSKDLQQVPQMEDQMIEIPPEIEIITSEGLDGLDKPDPNDLGFDGDREWQNTSEDEGGRHSRSSMPGGMRQKGESRSTTPKSVGFSPETITHETPVDEYPEDQEAEEVENEPVASGSSSSRGRRSRSNSPGRKQTAFDILKSKAAVAADHVRERIRAAIPQRPKISMSKSRKRRKVKHEQEETGDQEVPEDGETGEAKDEVIEEGEKTGEIEEMKEVENVEQEPAEKETVEEGDAGVKGSEEMEEEGVSEEKTAKQIEKEEKERKKAEEKEAKQKAAEEAKKAKLEEKLAKAREAEEKRQAKAEEEKRKQEEKEEAARKAAEAKKAEEERKAAEKAAKEEEARKVAEAKKAEEEARKAAEKAKKEEEARKKAEAKKAEEERKAAEKAKKAEEARLAAEAKKAEEERKAAEKAKKEEEARLAAEAKKVAEEEARKAAEAIKAEEEARKAEEAVNETPEEKIVESVQVDPTEAATEEAEVQAMETTEDAPADEGGPAEEETHQPETPCGTTKRKYIRHRKNAPIVLSQLPNPIASLRNQVEDFKNKLKRSRTPPRRIVQRKHRRSRSADASKSPPRDPDEVSKAEDEAEQETAVEGNPEEAGESSSAIQPDDAGTAQPPAGNSEQLQVEMETASIHSAAKSEGEVQQPEGGDDAEAPAPEPVSNTGTTGRRRRQQPAKEKLDKIGAQLKGLGAGAFGVVAQAGKGAGNVIKVVGKEVINLGAKAVGEFKSKPDPSKATSEPQEEEVEMSEEAVPTPTEAEITAPKRAFKFKRRNESAEEGDEECETEDQDHFYENAQALNRGESNATSENALLGSGARDWESPQDRLNSRGVSEERFSENVSCRDSPPGSSLASSTMAQVRRTGVLEEIDSDEFFLRERGISEGEDEEEVNRFLVEELRQAFRPSLSNALAGFDMEPTIAPPSRPDRAPRKPPRKDKDTPTNPSMYQTFPPERPKRKQPQGYVSKFMKEHGEEEDGEYLDSNEEVRGSTCDMEELEETDTLQRVKEKLSELDQDMGDEPSSVVEEEILATHVDEYVDDGRYEPISDHPTKPSRSKRKSDRVATPPSFYYNTIAGNEWLRELEDQVNSSEPPVPIRKRRGSGKSSSLPPASDDGHPHLDHLTLDGVPSQAASEMSGSAVPSVAESINGDYVDEAGYAIVQKDRDLPKTIPRKKKKRTNAIEQPSNATGPHDQSFFSLPRPGPREDSTPPTRPQRNYSTLRPRRPPRSKSGSRQNLDTLSPVPAKKESGDESSRPSTAIGIMQGRPLPPPPRPQRSPAPPLSDVDQSSFEMSVGLRHYANFEDMESQTLEEVLPPRVTEVDMACQTDPVPDDEFIVGLQDEDSGRTGTASSRVEGQETGDTAQRSTSTTTAEKIVDKQLNIPDSTTTEDFSEPERFDASVGSNIPSTVSPQLNNLNQTAPEPESSRTEPSMDVHPPKSVSTFPPRSITPEPEDEELEENVVCGSYTLPYSYMTPQPPSPPVRQSSLKKNHRSAAAPAPEPAPRSTTSPRRDTSHIAFGHTSVAQGDVLSVKLSIPVERASIGPIAPGQSRRSPPASPRPNRAPTAASTHLPTSPVKQAEAKKKDTAHPVTPPTASLPQAPRSQPPPPASPILDNPEPEENFFAMSARVGRAVLRLGMRALQTMADYIDTAASEDPSKAEQQRANMQVLLCLLLILLVGLLLATTRTGAYSSPRWEFLMPPPDL